jgi:hypothetical protein
LSKRLVLHWMRWCTSSHPKWITVLVNVDKTFVDLDITIYQLNCLWFALLLHFWNIFLLVFHVLVHLQWCSLFVMESDNFAKICIVLVVLPNSGHLHHRYHSPSA